MPQGSDYYQRKQREDLRGRVTIEKLSSEVSQLRARVRELEEKVEYLTRQTKTDRDKWGYWRR
jgi:predicted nuclease with TOPRIM domain